MTDWSKSLAMIKYLTLIIMMLLLCDGWSHPEDDFCQEAEMDPMLCAQLAELDRASNTIEGEGLPEIELDRSPFSTFVLYTQLGVEHIIPMGLDHLAFVLALLLSAATFRQLIIQISLFTLAHSVTLILSVMGVIVLQGIWIEVAIAFSIAFVAFENIFMKQTAGMRRYALVFAFGLLHGLGFAGALSDLGIPGGHFFSALLGFNLGVEIGQLGFATVVFLLLFKFMKKTKYRSLVVVPGSLMIGALGCYWVIERMM